MIITFKDGTRYFSEAKTAGQALADYLEQTKGDAGKVLLVDGKKITTEAIDKANKANKAKQLTPSKKDV